MSVTGPKNTSQSASKKHSISPPELSKDTSTCLLAITESIYGIGSDVINY